MLWHEHVTIDIFNLDRDRELILILGLCGELFRGILYNDSFLPLRMSVFVVNVLHQEIELG